MTKASILIPLSLAMLSGCSFAMRSADTYRDDTGKVLATKNDDIRSCYDGVLKSTPGAQGKVTVKFDVDTAQGKITAVTVDKANTTAPDPVAECVTKSITGLVLAPPDHRKGVAVWVYEFTSPTKS